MLGRDAGIGTPLCGTSHIKEAPPKRKALFFAPFFCGNSRIWLAMLGGDWDAVMWNFPYKPSPKKKGTHFSAPLSCGDSHIKVEIPI